MTCWTDRSSPWFRPRRTPSIALRRPNGVGDLSHRRFLAYLGWQLQWSQTAPDNCLILDTTVLPKRRKTMENLSLVYDHTQGKTVPGYEVLTLGLLTPRNFWPVDFDFRFSRTAPEGAREARPV